ncbi:MULTISPECIES: AlpA family transcriptional regulator [unclassified Neorhizobium]|uniref:helix-turn-helix transcriptional regulator n=1 Tax=unclassified Neorhizobium TaxID=2629175 RepID=UPI001FF3EC3A|nr:MULTISPECIES: DNA-binding protein [unclassified Neorhizobium]MCJ9672919.1 DNA-binding protein [Neorhizobium sp. SHOUNA12B]MCJ9748540.1 DNA-binding protein [Neorhizobium sp. SHOUNA12A]
MASSLREISIPRFALRRDEAAASLAISPSLFDNWVGEGKMPRGRKIGGIILWDAERIRSAWLALIDSDEPKKEDGPNPFDGRVV